MPSVRNLGGRPPRRSFLLLPLFALLLVPALRPAPPVAAAVATVGQEDAEAVALLRQAAEAMAALDGFHFELSTPRGQTLLLENIELVRVEGDVQRPDSFRASIGARAAIIDLSLRAVGIGSRIWVTNPLSEDDAFQELDLGQGIDGSEMDGATLVDLLNPDRILLQAVEQIQDPTIVGQDEIDGTDVTRVDGTVDLSRLEADGTPIPGLRTEAPLPVTIWIDDVGRVVRLELEGPLTAAEPLDVVRRLDLSRFDEPIDIQPPL